MSKEQRQNVIVVLAEPYAQMRRALRSALAAEGFRFVIEVGETNSFAMALNDPMPDVLVVDINLPGERDVLDMLREIRADKLGRNPFVPIIGSTWEAKPDRVRKAVDSGIDDLLVKPVAAGTVIERISVLARNRKPFIVTSDYIGPDRRRPGERPGDDDVARIDVPNSLKAKVEGKTIDPASWGFAKKEALSALNTQRLKAAAFQVSFLAEQLVPAMARDMAHPRIGPFLDRLLTTAADIAARARLSEQSQLLPLCDAVSRVGRELAEIHKGQADDPDRLAKNLKLLKQLADALLAGFNPDRAAGDMAEQVAQAIRRYQARVDTPASSPPKASSG